MTNPTGKGMFVWQLNRCAGGDPEKLATMARAAGLQWVAIKHHNGIQTRNGNFGAHALALRAAGIEPWGWGYIYGQQPELEADLAIWRTQELGLVGYFINAEHEYKAVGMGARAARFMGRWLQRAPTLPKGLCSYRFPSLHPQFPWVEFLQGCDFHAQQLYWLEDDRPNAPSIQLERSLNELRGRRPLPFVPLGSASPNDAATWFPTVAQLTDFHNACVRYRLAGAGWWAWDHAEAHPDWWAAISAHQWPDQPPAPSPVTPTPAERAAILGTRAHLQLASAAIDGLGDV